MGQAQRETESAPKLLAVDDEKDFLQFLKDGLGVYGYDVKTCKSGSDAIRCILGTHWDLVFSDYRMPGIDGKSLFRMVQSVNPKLAGKMIFITGVSFDRKVIDFLASTNCIFFRKPLKIETLVDAIKERLNP